MIHSSARIGLVAGVCRRSRRVAAVLLTAGTLLGVGVPSLAQGLGGVGTIDPGEGSGAGLSPAGTGITNPGSVDPGDGSHPGGDGGGKGKNDSPPPPPALPGSHAQPTAVVPADKVVADMDPSSALFDAINRGDSVAARDAINRGANLDGRNVLGLTPIELSVDLNRNDISFLLLSMRGAAGTPVVAPRAAPVPGGRAIAVSAPGRVRPSVRGRPDLGIGAAAVQDGFLGFDRAGGS